jgi:cell division protein FtsB
MSATARSSAARATPRQAPATRAPLAVVEAPRPKHSRSVFVALVAMVLALGLAALLTMNTVLAQDAFVLSALQQHNAELAVTEQALASQVAAQEDPNKLAARARGLGMHASGAPVFLNLSTHKIIGSRPSGTGGSSSYRSTP